MGPEAVCCSASPTSPAVSTSYPAFRSILRSAFRRIESSSTTRIRIVRSNLNSELLLPRGERTVTVQHGGRRGRAVEGDYRGRETCRYRSGRDRGTVRPGGAMRVL